MINYPKVIDSLVGMAAPMLGLITSMQEQFEYWLRVGSLIVGIAVGLVSLYRVLKK
jgi:ABC-type nickel/cobalt efflux system permease component RcnA|tara:strand:- start:112 stop:279 length:168 start_codon:yes stop_codon:yes gene_type:complete